MNEKNVVDLVSDCCLGSWAKQTKVNMLASEKTVHECTVTVFAKAAMSSSPDGSKSDHVNADDDPVSDIDALLNGTLSKEDFERRWDFS